MANDNELVLRITGDASKLSQALRDAGANIQAFSNNTKSSLNKSGMDSFAQSMNQVSMSVGQIAQKIAVTTVAMSGGVVGLLATSSKFEQWNVAFNTMLGSSEKASKLMSELTDFAKKTPFNTTEVVEYSKRLLAMGIQMEDIIPTMESLGNIAAGVGTEKLPQLVLAFGQVKAAGHLTGMELRQFTEAGVPLLEELSKSFGKSTSEIQKMISNGQIGFPAVQQALSNLSGEGGRFFNLMDSQSKTLGGMWSNVVDSFTLAAKKLGDALAPAAKDWEKSLLNIADALQNMDPGEIELIGKAIMSIATGLAAVWGISKVIGIFAGIASAFTTIIALFPAIKVAIFGVKTEILGANLVMQTVMTGGMSVATIAAWATGAAAVVGILYAAYNILGDNIRKAQEEHKAFIDAGGDKPVIFSASRSGEKQLEKDLEDSSNKIRNLKYALDKDILYSQKLRIQQQLKLEQENNDRIYKTWQQQVKANQEAETAKRTEHKKTALIVAQTEDQKEAAAKKAMSQMDEDFKRYVASIEADRDIDFQDEIDWWSKKQAKYKAGSYQYEEIEQRINNFRKDLRKEDEKDDTESLKRKLDSIKDNKRLTELSVNEQYLFQLDKLSALLDADFGANAERKKLIEEIKNTQLSATTQQMEDSLLALKKELDAENIRPAKVKEIVDAISKIEKDGLDAKAKDQKKYYDEMYTLGMKSATDLQGALAETLSKMFTDKEAGFLKPVTDGLTNMLGGVGSFMGGAIGGVVAQGIGSILQGLFGSSKTKTVAQYAEEAFKKMVDNTNKTLDDIGRQKSTTEKQLDILDMLKTDMGDTAIIPQAFLKSLELAQGTTVKDGMIQVLDRLKGFNDADVKALNDELSKLTALLPGLTTVANGGAAFNNMKLSEYIPLAQASGANQANLDKLTSRFSGDTKIGSISNYLSANRGIGAVGGESLIDAFLGQVDKIKGQKIATQDQISALSQKLASNSEFSLQEIVDAINLQRKVAEINATPSLANSISSALPSFDVGSMNIPKDMVAMLHKREIVIPADFADGLRSGKLTLTGAGTENSNDNRNINVVVQGGTKSAQQLFQEISPYINSSLPRRTKGAYNGIFRG
jgi:tape measure domain-containing protein